MGRHPAAHPLGRPPALRHLTPRAPRDARRVNSTGKPMRLLAIPSGAPRPTLQPFGDRGARKVELRASSASAKQRARLPGESEPERAFLPCRTAAGRRGRRRPGAGGALRV